MRAVDTEAEAHRLSVRCVAEAAGVFLLLAILHTWPLASGLGQYSRNNDDERLNTWVISWIAHQLPRDPLHLFDGNIFHPNRYALAYTEPLIIPGVMGAPLRWGGASPVLTYNVLVLVGFVLTGLAMYILVARWTGDHWSGLLAGSLLAFSTTLLTRIPHLQILHLYWLPLAILVLQQLLAQKRARSAVLLGGCVVGAALTSGYLVIFVSVALGGAFLLRADSWWGRDGVRILTSLGLTAVVTVVVLLLVLWPYQALRRDEGLHRFLAPETSSVTRALESYLSTAGRLHYSTWSQEFYERAPASLFPTGTGLVLAGVAFGARRRVAPRGARRMLMGVAVVGVIFSLGSLTPVYVWAYHVLPPLQSLRATSRFGILVVFAVSAAAGLGLAVLRQWAPRRWLAVLSAGLLSIATVESCHAPIPYSRSDWNRPIYRALAAATEPGAVLELPIYSGGSFTGNAPYVLASTTHWRPLVNGFAGYRPPTFDELAQLVGTFPNAVVLARLRDLDVRYVVVHTAQYRRRGAIEQALARLDGRSDVTLVAREGSDRLYRIVDPMPTAPTAVTALLNDLEWADLTFVDGPAVPGSVLRAKRSLGVTFGLQAPGHFIVYMEDAGPGARLSLRLPERMTGEFFHAASGASLGRVSVRRDLGAPEPTTLDVPTGSDAILLVLRASGER